jgi:hypothetical protein
VLDRLAAIQMLDVHFPTTDGRTLILSRYTELNAEQKLLVKQLKLDLAMNETDSFGLAAPQTSLRSAIG